MKDDCQCNLTNVEHLIRENAISIDENKFVIGVHRDRINENEESSSKDQIKEMENRLNNRIKDEADRIFLKFIEESQR